MMNKPPPFKDLNVGIPSITPIKGRGFILHGSTLTSSTNCWWTLKLTFSAGVVLKSGELGLKAG